MSEQPTAQARPSAAGGKKILGVPRTTFYLAVGGAVIVGLAFYWWRNYQAAQQSASTASTTGTTGTGVDYSGELSTIQTELEALLQQEGVTTTGTGTTGSGGGQSWGNGGGWSGGGGSGSGGDYGGSSSDNSGSSSSGSSSGSSSNSGSSTAVNGAGSPPVTSSGSSSTTTTASTASKAPPGPTGGRVVSVNNNDATVAWNANGASKWNLKITGPGAINGHTATVTSPQGVYSGLEAGHTYTVTVTPLSSTGVAGPSGNITIKTT